MKWKKQFELERIMNKSLINYEEIKVFIKSILNSEILSTNEFIKLLNRSVTESLIRYIILWELFSY